MSEEESEDVPTESEASVSEESEFSEPASDASTNSIIKKRRMGRRKMSKFRFDEETETYRCNSCPRSFASKSGAYKHTGRCKDLSEKQAKALETLKCEWCNLEFQNRGNLASHAYHLHGDSSYKSALQKESPKMFKCDVCHFQLQNRMLLKYHIRKMHYNLKAKRPYADTKNVNQVWFEKVINTNIIIEIKKIARNRLVMRKLSEGTAIKIPDTETETIDLTHIYPTEYKSVTNAKSKVKCEICKGWYNRNIIRKHMREVHLNLKKHFCNNCNRSFKRSYQYLKHVCFKPRKGQKN